MYSLFTSSRNSNELTICFEEIVVERKSGKTDKKRVEKGKLPAIMYLKDVFIYAENQETYV